MRKTGKTYALALTVKDTLSKGDNFVIVSKSFPSQLTTILTSLEVPFTYDPLIRKGDLTAIYDREGGEEFIYGFENSEDKIAGYIFKPL